MADELNLGETSTTPAAPTGETATETPVDTPATPTLEPATDADPMAALNAAMDAEFGAETPETPAKPGETPAIPAEFEQIFSLSDFVTEPAHVENAVRAADEVWKVASGQLPARQMLEGFRDVNPQQYQAIVQDLATYISEVTGMKFGESQPQPGPLDELKAANPQAYEQIAQFFKQTTGKELGGPLDPRDARLSALEQRYAQEAQQREQEAYQQQVRAGDEAAYAFLAGKLKGTFAEGMEEHFIGLMAQKLGKDLSRSMQEVLNGNTKSLEKAYDAVKKDEVARIRKYNANLVQRHNTLANGLPNTKGTTSATTPARKEGETDIQFATRLWNEGK